jgi:hypothetical protein
MVKEHPFTVLCDLLREPNNDVKDVFKKCAIKSAPQQRQTSPRMLEMIVAKEPMNKDVAKQRMDDLLARISNCGDNYFAVFQEMSKVLTTDGIGKLLVLLKDNLSDEFLKDDNYQYLFKGMPIFKIVVKEDDLVRGMTDGKCDIILQHTGTGARELIKFETRPSKALYLLFLLMPRKEIKQINQYRKILQDLLNIAFDIVEKEDKKHKLDDKFVDDKVFAESLKQIMSSARRSIEKAIVDRDDLAWYTIDYDRSDSYYSLSLPEEMIDLSKAPSLVEFRNKYLIK